MEAERSSETLLVSTTPQHDATIQTAIMRKQPNAHCVENTTADSSNAAHYHLIRTSKALRNKKTPMVTVTDRLFTLSSCLYRASVTIKTLYYPTDEQVYNS